MFLGDTLIYAYGFHYKQKCDTRGSLGVTEARRLSRYAGEWDGGAALGSGEIIRIFTREVKTPPLSLTVLSFVLSSSMNENIPVA